MTLLLLFILLVPVSFLLVVCGVAALADLLSGGPAKRRKAASSTPAGKAASPKANKRTKCTKRHTPNGGFCGKGGIWCVECCHG